jgi:hypothetical protein
MQGDLVLKVFLNRFKPWPCYKETMLIRCVKDRLCRNNCRLPLTFQKNLNNRMLKTLRSYLALKIITGPRKGLKLYWPEFLNF